MVVRGQFFILGAIVILLDLFVLSHFLARGAVSSQAPSENAYLFAKGYGDGLSAVFENSPRYMLGKDISTYRSLSRERAVWSYQFFDLCDNLPCSRYAASSGDCGFNFSIAVIGDDEQVNSMSYVRLGGPSWWNGSFPLRLGFKVYETDELVIENETLRLDALMLPSGALVNSIRVVGDSEEPLLVNDENSNGVVDDGDSINFNYSLSPSRSRIYYIYYAESGNWTMPSYGFDWNGTGGETVSFCEPQAHP